MAFQNVNEKKTKKVESFLKLTDLEVGGSMQGYLTGIGSNIIDERTAYTLYMNIEGKVFGVNVAGNVKYLIQDGKVKEGFLTRITRIEDTKVKGKKSTQYTVEQDFDAPIELAALDQVAPNVGETTATPAPKAPSQADKKRSNLAQKAKMLEEAN